MAEMPKEIKVKVDLELEGQGSDLLRELARIELQAAVGNELVRRISQRIADHALDSPGNLRLARTLLTDRSQSDGASDTEMGFSITVDEDIEDWVVEGADDALEIIDLWNLLLDAERLTLLEGMDGLKVWSLGRTAAVAEIQRVFVELEIRLGPEKR